MSSGVLSFTFNASGYGSEQAENTQIAHGIGQRIVRATRSASATQRSYGVGTRKINIIRRCSAALTSHGSAFYGINIGYTNVVTLGDMVLSSAEKMDYDEFEFISNERILYDGSRSLQTGNTDGFAGKFKCATQDYNEIKLLRGMIGKQYTLRIWGIPYRNVCIWNQLRVREVKKGLNLWVYEIELRQDTATVQRTE